MGSVIRRAFAALALAALLPHGLVAQGFIDVTVSTGVSVAPNPFQNLGRGPCFGDFDGDGDQDLVMPLGFEPSGNNNLVYYRNNGNGTFTDVTGSTGLFNSVLSRGATAADVDNDGDLDLFIANSWSPDALWINNGSAFFTEEGSLRGVASMLGSFTASFGDYNRDGWLDLYVGTWAGVGGSPDPNILYQNTGNGMFVDVTAAAGVANGGFTYAGIFFDYNEDGWPDIYIGNDKGYNPGIPRNTTYMNNGDGTFTDVGIAIGTYVGMGSMGADFADVFNDGDWDVFVSNDDSGHVFQVWDPATGMYTDEASTFQVEAFIEGWAVHWMDYDNDGRQDLYVEHYYQADHLYRNIGWPGPWPNVASQVGCAISGQKYASAVADFDNDGRLDIFIPRSNGLPGTTSVFLRNTVPGGNWLRVVTRGTISNRDGIGATLIAHVGNETYRRRVKSGVGYLGGNDLRVHFGLGAATAVDLLEIRWPLGQVQRFWNVPVNQELVAQEPALSLAGIPLPGATISLEHDSGNDAALLSVLYLSLGSSPGIPLPDGRVLPGNLDALGSLTFLAPGNPVLPTPYGPLDATGLRSTPLLLPFVPALTGLEIHATGASVDPTIPWPWSPVRNILNPLSILIQ